MTGHRVLHLITTLDRGGAENALLHLCGGFAAEPGWEAAVGYLKGDGELRNEFEAAGVPVHDVGLGAIRVDRALSRTKQLLADFDPDVVHTHLFKADCLGAAVAGSSGRPVLVSTKHNEDVYLARNDPVSLAWRTLGKGAARRADAMIAISDGVAAFVRRHLGESGGRLETIRYGVPEPAAGDGQRFRAAHGLPPDAPVILCVARLEPQKDHDTLLQAFAALSPDHGAYLVLLGRGSREEDLRAIAGERVVFAGFVDDPADAYAAADIVALSSRHEGLGLVLVEAGLAGVPAVATQVGGIPEAMAGPSGVLVPPGEPGSFAAGLEHLLADATLRKGVGERAREFARERFSVARYLSETKALYDDLLRGTP